MQSTFANNDADQDIHREGPVTKEIEHKTANIPSDLFLLAALGSIGISALLKCFGKKDGALFVGQWAAPFLLLGVYNKLVKVAGHDKQDKSSNPDGL